MPSRTPYASLLRASCRVGLRRPCLPCHCAARGRGTPEAEPKPSRSDGASGAAGGRTAARGERGRREGENLLPPFCLAARARPGPGGSGGGPAAYWLRNVRSRVPFAIDQREPEGGGGRKRAGGRCCGGGGGPRASREPPLPPPPPRQLLGGGPCQLEAEGLPGPFRDVAALVRPEGRRGGEGPRSIPRAHRPRQISDDTSSREQRCGAALLSRGGERTC